MIRRIINHLRCIARKRKLHESTSYHWHGIARELRIEK